MEHKQAKTLVSVMILLCASLLAAQCQTVDWVTHRGGPTRTGTNNDTGIVNAQQPLGFVYKYPNTASMPPEIVVDNLQTTPNATGQSFTTNGAWFNAVNTSDNSNVRASGAWPPADPNPANVGDYVYAHATYDATLGSTIGESTLALLPDLGTDGSAVQTYSEVNGELPTNASTTWAQWSFGTAYPAGTKQGTTDVSGQPLAANQRYAIYIRFPNSGTIVNNATFPNVDYAMVRVSWGANVDDPVTSRIFMLNFGQTGGFWLRIRTGPGDDRYFPYDGVHPIRVTLYNITPDPNTNAIVPANAVRLVPEQGRGDIHDAPVSRMFPQNPPDPNYPNAEMQLTYFGRDETKGPGVLFPSLTNPGSPAGFQAIPLNPTQAVDPVNNPVVADPTSSIRYAAFYCLEDDDANINNPTNKNYGVLRWRYVASPTPQSYVVDDNSSGASYSPDPGPPNWTSVTGNDCYGTEYQTTPAVAAATSVFSWKTQVPITSSTDSTTYSVYVWIPAAEPAPGPSYVTQANYSIVTSAGTQNYTLDQQAAPTTTGGWRLLASHIQFPGVGGGTLMQAVDISLNNQSTQADVTNNNVVVADAVELVAENQLTNSVLASPLIQDVTWPSGKTRTVVYFGTGDGHVWCLDALGGNGTTTPYWVYPSISNPRLPNGIMNGPQDDPNYNPDLYNLEGRTGTDGRTDGGIYAIDGDLSPTPSGQEDPNTPPGNYTVVNTVPSLGPFISSPSYVVVKQGNVSIPYIVIGNQNGRVYAFDPAGRTVSNPNLTGETIGEPYQATLVNHIAGTGRRTMTWPSLGRDKWMQSLIEAYVDDSDGNPAFTTVNGFTPVNPAPVDAMANKGNYHEANAVDPTTPGVVVATATWTTSVQLDPNVKAPVFDVYVWIPADLNGNFAHSVQYTLTTATGPQIVTFDQRNVLPPVGNNPALPPVGKWRLLATDVNFPVDANNKATLTLSLSNASATDAAANRIVVADSVMFVSQLPTDVKTVDNTYPPGQFDAYPSISSFTKVTDTVSWNGSNFTYLSAPVVAAPSTLYATWTQTLTPPAGTTMYSVYAWIPSVGSANFTTSAHYQLNTSTGFKDVYINQNNFTPTIPGDRWVLLQNHVVFKQNLNGNFIGQVTIYNDGSPADIAAGHVVALSALKFVSESNGGVLSDDPPKGAFAATPAIHTDPATGSNDRIIDGSGDGVVYCVDMQNNDPHQRLSNLLAGGVNIGQPRWFYTTPTLSPILQPGALTSEGVDGNYIFSAGQQVFDISDPETVSNGTPTVNWTFSPSVTENFTAPAWIPAGNANINGGNAAVFVANQSGSIYELDGATGSQKWASPTYGATRAPVTFLANLPYQAWVTGAPKVSPAVLLPLDTGAIIGLDASDTGLGKLIWSLQDGLIGFVPLQVDNAGTIQQFSTSNVWRGSEAITSNMWVYSSDEGNQDNGEVNGQLHAYFNTAYTNDYIPPGEPGISPTGAGAYLEGVDIRLADVWDSTKDVATSPWANLGQAGGTSPYDAWRTGTWKSDTTDSTGNDTHFLVYEWGDTIYTAAWGGYRGVDSNGNLSATNVPQVTFTLTGGGQNQTQTVAAKQDLAYTGSQIFVYVPGDPTNTNPALRVPQWLPGYAWYATAQFTIGRSSQVFAQTPGSVYHITVSAKQTSTAFPGKPSITVPTIQLQAGQYVLTTPNFKDGSGTNPNPPEYYDSPPVAPTYTLYGTEPSNTGRNITFANPLAITTRGNVVGPGTNEMGWGASANGVFSEVLSNGNRLVTDPATGTPGVLTVSGLKDVFAPMGFIKDNSSATYSAVDTNGNPVQALAIADRSDMYKLAQPLNNIRVARYSLRWNYRNNDPTMGVMNALPWEDTYLIPTHNSVDYPDIPAIDMTVMPANSTTDMTQQAVTLPMATVVNNVKTLNPLVLNLNVKVPQYQPANISTAYYGINDLAHTSSNAPDVYGPMNVTTGLPATPNDSAAVKLLLAPTAGYVGTVIVFVDSSGTGTFQGNAALPGVQNAQTPTSTEMAFRQFNVGLAVPPDFSIQTQEQTVDLGQEPQGAGYSPFGANGTYSIPFAPSGVGPYTGSTSPWDNPNGTSFFAPFTIKNNGNINLLDLRVAKLIGNNTAPTNIASWLGLTSDQVPISTGVGQLWAPGFNTNGPPAAGNIGIVSSLDHSITVNGQQVPDSWDSVPNLWPIPNPNWPGNSQPRPTLHKPDVGDTSPTIMYLGDGPNGAQFGGKPKIGFAVPLGTPVGTYSTQVLVFEDETPPAWRNWVNEYSTWNNLTDPLNLAVNDDGILNTPMNGTVPSFPAVEPVVSNPFTLKTTVTEARLTNGTTAGSEYQLDVRLPGDAPNGANAMPAVMMNNNAGKNDIYLYWSSNRILSNGKWVDPGTPDAPWNLFYSTLPSASNATNNVFDWQFGTQQSWWDAINGPYPPAPAGDVPSTIKNLSPCITTDPANNTSWLFWQYTAAMNTNVPTEDTRTFYTRLNNGVPDTTFNGGSPAAFSNDPSLPKYGPKAVVLNGAAWLFWFSGTNGRTRLYFNYNPTVSDPTKWQSDTILVTPGSLQWASNPVPVLRNDLNPPCIDLIYTGKMPTNGQAETFLTRYVINGNQLNPAPLPPAQNELMARVGSTQTWQSRDVAWTAQYNTNPPISIMVNGTQVNTGNASWDNATGKIYYSNPNGGEIVIDPTVGTVTFTGKAPAPTDVVTANYIPQTMRLNVNRNNLPPDPVSGSSTNPCAFLDMSPDQYPGMVFAAGSNAQVPPAQTMPVTRYWLFYRKTGSGLPAPAQIYYKTMRLMVRLNHGVLLNPDGTVNNGTTQNITVTGNVGPYEVDWARGRVYFTPADEGRTVTITYNWQSTQNGNAVSTSTDTVTGVVSWQDEISAAVTPTDQSASEVALPTKVSVNEGQVAAFKDPFENKVWVFWVSTRDGTPDLYYETISPQFYLIPAQ